MILRNLKNYYRPTTVEEAVSLVQSSSKALYLGGGAWIVAQGDATLETVVDLQAVQVAQGVGLDHIEANADGVRIGAMATLQDIIDHRPATDGPGDSESSYAGTIADGLLATAAGYTQSRGLREQGTLGGTLIVAGPADPLTTALMVLDVDIRYADPTIHTAPFISFVAYRDRLIRTRVLITDIFVKRPPALGGRSAAVFEIVGRSPKDKPIVCVAAIVTVEDGISREVHIAVGGAHATPTRLHKTEHLLKGQAFAGLDAFREKVMSALEPALATLEPIGDFRGSATYRLEMTRVLARRALLSAWERARQI
jgi:CO/xanthine dehydrogenase FAD-binding subunit